jgi:hypothetical protein
MNACACQIRKIRKPSINKVIYEILQFYAVIKKRSSIFELNCLHSVQACLEPLQDFQLKPFGVNLQEIDDPNVVLPDIIGCLANFKFSLGGFVADSATCGAVEERFVAREIVDFLLPVSESECVEVRLRISGWLRLQIIDELLDWVKIMNDAVELKVLAVGSTSDVEDGVNVRR